MHQQLQGRCLPTALCCMRAVLTVAFCVDCKSVRAPDTAASAGYRYKIHRSNQTTANNKIQVVHRHSATTARHSTAQHPSVADRKLLVTRSCLKSKELCNFQAQCATCKAQRPKPIDPPQNSGRSQGPSHFSTTLIHRNPMT
jgi:hypothetical protein